MHFYKVVENILRNKICYDFTDSSEWDIFTFLETWMVYDYEEILLS